MKLTFLNIVWLFISLSCICGMCSKGDENGNSNNSGSNYTEPVLNPNDTWVYMASGDFIYANNYVGGIIRPLSRKWIASGINSDLPFHAAYSFPNTAMGSDTSKNSLVFDFENTALLTRFCSNTLNPNGKEKMDIVLNKFDRTPGSGTYTMDIDNKEGFVGIMYIKQMEKNMILPGINLLQTLH